MAVRRTKDGKWVADVTVGVKWDGTRDRRTRVCRTKKEAQAAERAFLIERDGRRGISGRITFHEFVDTLWWPQKAGLRRNSRDTYRQVLARRLMPAFGDMDIDRINRASVQKMILSCPTRKSAQKAREVLSSVLGNAVELGMIAVNPASFRYQYPKKGDRCGTQGAWLTAFAQHRRLLEHLRRHCPGTSEERMVALGLCLGLRKGEIFGLDWEDVDLARGTVAIRRTYTVGEGAAALDDPKTERGERTIPLTSWLAGRMESWGPGSGPIVTGRDGGRMNPDTAGRHMRKLVSGCYDDGGPMPRVTLYTLRHSFATACIGAGIEVAKVSRWLGHCDVSTTYNRYVRPMLGDLEAETSVIDAAMGCVETA